MIASRFVERAFVTSRATPVHLLEVPVKNHSQSPSYFLRHFKTYTHPPSQPVVIMATVQAAATSASDSRNQIHALNTVNPTYKSTRDTIPHGFASSQLSCSVLLPAAVEVDSAHAMTANIAHAPATTNAVACFAKRCALSRPLLVFQDDAFRAPLAKGSSSAEELCASHIPPVAVTLACKLGLLRSCAAKLAGMRRPRCRRVGVGTDEDDGGLVRGEAARVRPRLWG